MIDDGATMTCEIHGGSKWRGDLVCAVCGRIYLDSEHRRQRCDCGATFWPPTPWPLSIEFSARVICAACADAHPERHTPATPSPGMTLEEVEREHLERMTAVDK